MFNRWCTILFDSGEETQIHISNTFQMGRNVCIVYQRDPTYEKFNSHSLGYARHS